MGWAGSPRILVCYLLIFVANLVFDQATKLHAESRLQEWSHATDLRSYRADKRALFSFGTSAAGETELRRKGVVHAQRTQAWLDINVTYVRNPGAAWGGFMKLSNGLRLALFVFITLLVSGILVYLLSTLSVEAFVLRCALLMVGSGAWGNFTDRLFRGYVVDWLHLHWRLFGKEQSFPVFNWADIAINLGLLIFVVNFLKLELLNIVSRKSGDSNA